MNVLVATTLGAVFVFMGCRARQETKPEERSAVASASSAQTTALNVSPSSAAPMGSAAVAVDSAAPPVTPSPSAISAESVAPAQSGVPAPKKKKTAVSNAPSGAVVEQKPSRGPSVDGAAFTTWLETTGGYRVGTAGTIMVVLSAKAPYHCNAEYPHKFKLDAAGPNVKYASTTVTGMHVDGTRGSMPISFTPTAPGEVRVSGTLSFSVCDAERCLVEKRSLSVSAQAR